MLKCIWDLVYKIIPHKKPIVKSTIGVVKKHHHWLSPKRVPVYVVTCTFVGSPLAYQLGKSSWNSGGSNDLYGNASGYGNSSYGNPDLLYVPSTIGTFQNQPLTSMGIPVDQTPINVPEPSTALIFAMAILLLGAIRCRLKIISNGGNSISKFY